jgi:hypothetical protein
MKVQYTSVLHILKIFLSPKYRKNCKKRNETLLPDQYKYKLCRETKISEMDDILWSVTIEFVLNTNEYTKSSAVNGVK